MRKSTVAVNLTAAATFLTCGVIGYNEVGPGSVVENHNPSGDGNAGYDPTHPQNGDNTEAPTDNGTTFEASPSATHRAAASCALVEVLLNDGIDGAKPGTVRAIFRVANGTPEWVTFTDKNTLTVAKAPANPLDAEQGNTVADVQFKPKSDNKDGQAHATVEVTTVSTEGNPAQTLPCGEVVSDWHDGVLTSAHAG